MSTSASRRDIHAEITGRIVAVIEANPAKPELPWHRASAPLQLPTNVASGNAYQGINILSLWLSSQITGYTSNVWGTYKQWAANGCQVRKGEKSSLVVFYKEYATAPDPDNEADDGRRRVAKASFAFNAEQVEGFNRLPPVSTALSSLVR